MRFRPPRARRLARALAGAALIAAATASAAPRGKTAVLSPDLRVVMESGDEIVLLARVQPRESLDAFARRIGEDPAAAKKAIRSANGGLSRLKPGHWVRVPYRALSAAYRKSAIEGLFPADHATPAGWEHRVAAVSGKPESLWMIAEWFTGDGARYKEIREVGGIPSLETREGQVVTVPERLLVEPFRAAVVAATAAAVPPAADAEVPRLEYGEDAQGRYAIYRLRKGEALYSAVVVRFTGRLHAEDVNAKAAELAARNGIADVHAMPVGFPVRIPIEDLAPEFRPPGDPERVAEEKTRLEAAQFANKIRSSETLLPIAEFVMNLTFDVSGLVVVQQRSARCTRGL